MLTDREKELLSIIVRLTAERGFPPTIREIGEAAGISSTNGVRYFLQRLEAKGHVRRSQGLSRGIELTTASAARPAASGSHGKASAPGWPAAGPQPVLVPLLGRVAAGQPVISDEHVEDMLMLDPSIAGRGRTFALRVRGDSMKDAGILDRDMVVVREQREARPGEIVVALVDGEATVKTYRVKRTGVVLEPANEAFAPIEIAADRRLDILGKVVAVLRKVDA